MVYNKYSEIDLLSTGSKSTTNLDPLIYKESNKPIESAKFYQERKSRIKSIEDREKEHKEQVCMKMVGGYQNKVNMN